MEEGFVQAGPVRLQFFEHGHGPEAIVLVHGYSASARIWRLTQEALDADRFRVIAISNRGAGDSDRSADEVDYMIEAFARDLHAAVMALGLDQFALVGHSMGGLTVTQYALDHQERLRALVLLDSAPLEGPPEGLAENRPMPASRPAASDRSAAPGDFLELLRADVARNPPERMSAGRKAMAAANLRSRLGELRLPVLVVAGDQDRLVGMRNILTDYLALPAASRSLHVFHGVGHEPNIAVPAALARVIERFLLGAPMEGTETPPG